MTYEEYLAALTGGQITYPNGPGPGLEAPLPAGVDPAAAMPFRALAAYLNQGRPLADNGTFVNDPNNTLAAVSPTGFAPAPGMPAENQSPGYSQQYAMPSGWENYLTYTPLEFVGDSPTTIGGQYAAKGNMPGTVFGLPLEHVSLVADPSTYDSAGQFRNPQHVVYDPNYGWITPTQNLVNNNGRWGRASDIVDRYGMAIIGSAMGIPPVAMSAGNVAYQYADTGKVNPWAAAAAFLPAALESGFGVPASAARGAGTAVGVAGNLLSPAPPPKQPPTKSGAFGLGPLRAPGRKPSGFGDLAATSVVGDVYG